MIKVSFKYTDDGKTMILKVDGHSEQNDIGKDIICASASILAYAFAQWVKDMHSDGLLVKEPKISLKSGDALITCKPKDEAYAEALNAFVFTMKGYNLLAHNYPQFVDLKVFAKSN